MYEFRLSAKNTVDYGAQASASLLTTDGSESMTSSVTRHVTGNDRVIVTCFAVDRKVESEIVHVLVYDLRICIIILNVMTALIRIAHRFCFDVVYVLCLLLDVVFLDFLFDFRV